MTYFKILLIYAVVVLLGAVSATALTTNDANTIFTAYNSAF